MEKKWRKIAIFQKMKNCNFPRVFFIFFHFFHFFNHFSSFLLPVVQKFCKKWKITIFLGFFSYFNIFLKFLFPVVELVKNDKTWWKMIKQMIKKMKKMKKKTRGKLKFSKKWKIAIFLEVFSFFSFFYHFFNHSSSFLLPGCKNFPRNGKLQFSSIFYHFFNHFLIIFLSFLLPVVELMKNDKTWWKMIKKMKKKSRKIAIFQKMKNCNFPRVFFIFSFFFIFFIFL